MATTIWKGALSFGLLNIPVNLYKSEERRDFKLSMLDEENLSPIKYKKVNAKTGQEVPWERIVKGYEYAPEEFVILTKEDLKKANPRATQTIDILDFVESDEVDTLYFDKSYYMVPQKNGVKGYFLLHEALVATQKAAICKVVIRTKEHLAMVVFKENYLVLTLLKFNHEVILPQEVHYLDEFEVPTFSDKELQMAIELIEGMTAPWNPTAYEDTYTDDVLKLIEKKVTHGEIEQIEEDTTRTGATGVVLDLLPLLQKSISDSKKVREKKSKKKSSNKKVG
ncbi:MAG TPA: Ku protein [Bacteriovoracaceae bacterium]|nr:Ku protein [Bacteriovoracaceae bacterium]